MKVLYLAHKSRTECREHATKGAVVIARGTEETVVKAHVDERGGREGYVFKAQGT